MSALTKNHLERLRTTVLKRHSSKSIPEWLCEHTTIEGRKFTFKNHEYQEAILRDDSRVRVIKKCAQVGLSELSVREALAWVGIVPGFTGIYLLPTSKFASTFSRTRADPVIIGSDYLKDAISKTVDSGEVKQFNTSYLFFKGCQSSSAPISIPASGIWFDEFSFANMEIAQQYESRLTHSTYKKKTYLSTPTLPAFGIDAQFDNSKRKFMFVKCEHCAHQFVPSYYSHVKIPGFDGDLLSITKRNLPNIRWEEAKLHCPKCGRVPSLQPEYREWVTENPDENHEASGWQVSPWDSPNIVSASDLVRTSCNYARLTDFKNYALGESHEDSESTLSREELQVLFSPAGIPSNRVNVIGIDLGMTNHLLVGALGEDGSIDIVYAEKIVLADLRTRLHEISLRFNASVIVSDALPYTESIIAMQAYMPNLWGAIFTRSKSVELYSTKVAQEDDKKGRELIRQVNISRDKAFDSMVYDLRGGLFSFRTMEHRDEIIDHFTDLKRIRIFDQDNEMSFTWKKSAMGEDHFAFACLFLYIAARLKGTAHVSSISSFGMNSIRIPDKFASPMEGFWDSQRGWGSPR